MVRKMVASERFYTDDLVSMAAEMLDIVIKHVAAPTRTLTVGADGAGEIDTDSSIAQQPMYSGPCRSCT